MNQTTTAPKQADNSLTIEDLFAGWGETSQQTVTEPAEPAPPISLEEGFWGTTADDETPVTPPNPVSEALPPSTPDALFSNPPTSPVSHSFPPSPAPIHNQTEKSSMLNTLFGFKGRIPRSTFWMYSVIMAVVIGGICLTPLAAEAIVLSILALVNIWVSLALIVKRYHDLGKSWVWALIGLVPFIGGIWLLVECGFFKGQPATNDYGHPV